MGIGFFHAAVDVFRRAAVVKLFLIDDIEHYSAHRQTDGDSRHDDHDPMIPFLEVFFVVKVVAHVNPNGKEVW